MWYYIIGIIILIYICTRPSTSDKNIKKLMKQAAKWSVAAQQDDSPITAMLHANWASGYLWALKDISTEQEIHRVTKIDLSVFESHIEQIQSEVTKKVLEKCPEFQGHIDLYLNHIAEN
jgi:hypothetical protein